MRTRASANEVAKHLLRLAERDSLEDDRVCITPMQLQKLLYYAQGWALADWGQPLFDEPIEAWKHGPVVKSVYEEYKPYRGGAILPDHLDESALTIHEAALVGSVWDRYKGYSALALSDMTHAEEPWREARRGVSDEAPTRHLISADAMKREFRGRLDILNRRMASEQGRLQKLAEKNANRLFGRAAL